MQRSRGSDVTQKQSSRGLQQLRKSRSDSDPLHHRPVTARSPKLGDRRSPRGAQYDPMNQKKLGTRIADLESQFRQAQDELKILKEQLASAEDAKREAQEELEKKTKKSVVPELEKFQDKCPPTNTQEFNRTVTQPQDEIHEDTQQETDVFEVPVEKVAIQFSEPADDLEKETKAISISSLPEILELEKQSLDDLSWKNEEIIVLKTKLEEKEKELELMGQENKNLKNQLNEAHLKISSALTKEEEMTIRVKQLGEELEASKTNVAKLDEKLEAVEGERESLVAEMKKLRVQTEQWRKAADAAAAVLAGGVEMNSRISDRCSSTDKHFGGMFDSSTGGYAGFVGSPGMADDMDDGFGSGKRKGSGIRMFSDLWKKKGQK
ncbi:Interactor of constitutive active ROPs [Quillaja saponaria]|uniref:Interactor of constitutive active ROPs n=1 Tax=Quillaja saponaria TaxID=32244 RepID=A0AAD7QIE9_QUISA|nr:Interactor of constitutive active ROPs [Quillaja saponaria]KAJ7981959.1 Interactor of constitutive active ROPs [Quillaja saponaria]